MEVKLFIFLCYIRYSQADGDDATDFIEIPPDNPDSFFYFAYGSNLLQKRIHLNAPSASFYSIAKLKDYRLDFNVSVSLWNGAVATIAHDPGNQVWGVIWVIANKDKPRLDQQEGLGRLYHDLQVPVVTLENKLIANTYKQYVDPPKPKYPWDIPIDRLPSRTYLRVILHGAAEAGLPDTYTRKLKSIPDNGMLAAASLRNYLGYPFLS